MTGNPMSALLETGERLRQSLFAIAGRGLFDRLTPAANCGPPPEACWLPQELPPIQSRVGPAGTARIRVRVHNIGLRTRTVFLAATGPDAGLAWGDPSTATISALETGDLVAALTLPRDACRAEVLLWVRGCRDTAVSWTVTGDADGCDQSHTATLEDGPRTRHQWHDHFAQPYPCSSGRHD